MARRSWTRAAALAVVATLSPTAGAAHASADTPACVAFAQPAGASGTEAPPITCFGSLAEAVAHATGGVVTFPAGTPRGVILARLPAALTEASLSPPDQSGTTVIGIDHDVDGVPMDLVWAVDDLLGCTGGGQYQVPTMPDGWNDRVDAATAYQGCDLWVHYEHTFYGGSSITCPCTGMGVMEDQTSSERWSRDLTPWGLLCGLTTTADPTGEENTQTGVIDGGPLTFRTPSLVAASLTCTVQVGANSTHAGSDAFTVTGPTTTGVMVLPETPVSYEATEEDNVYLCSQVNIEGRGTLYFNDPNDPLVDGEWSSSPTAHCGLVISASTPGEDEFPWDILLPLSCGVADVLPGPVQGILRDLLGCWF